MPSQFFNFTKYFKKDSSKSTDDTSSDPGQTQSTSVSYSQESSQASTPQPYSGIGNPPGGRAYSGIGNPSANVSQPATVTTASSVTSVQKPMTNLPAEASAKVGDQQPDQTPQSSIDMDKRVGMDVISRLTQRANTVLMKSVNKVKELKIQYIDTEHVLWGLLQDSSIYQLISDSKAVPSEIQAALEKSFKKGNFAGIPQFSPRVKRVLELSLSAARSLGYEFISPEHILLALSHEGEGVAAQVLTKNHLTREVLNQKITGKKDLSEKKEDRKGTALEQFTDDLTAKASRGELDPVVGRSWEIERIIHILSRRTKNNPVLIGDAGVGKTAIVEGLAERIAKGDVPETLLHKKILLLDLMSLIAGARHRGEFEERLKNLIKEVKSAAGAIILFIDEVHNMVGAGSGSEGTMDASNILKPSLARGELQVIGTTTITEYRKYIEKDPALERRFQPVLVSEPTAETAIEMVTALRDKYEAFHRVKIPDAAIDSAVRLSQRYISDRFLPDKAVDLIDEAAAAVRLPAISLPEEIKSSEAKIKKLNNELQEADKLGDAVRTESLKKEIEETQVNLEKLKEQYQVKKSTTTNSVSPETIAEVVSRWTNIPVSRLTESEAAKLLELEKTIHKRLINQEEAVSAVSEAVRRGRAGLKSNKRPIGSFIFMGPTGVGKTELAKCLAEILFGSQELMVRLDMTEYMEKHEVAKLIGAPPGYVGYEEGGQLTEAVRRRPYAVVLFDEIEKAHPDVFNILIQLLDDGRLTDNKGRTISFKNTIVICTSNLGSGIIQEEMLNWGKEELRQLTPPVPLKIFATYVVSPTGREIMTLDDTVWKKEPQEDKWKKDTLKNYFAGSVVTGITLKEGEKLFPEDGFDTHVIAPDGSETITHHEKVWFRTSTTAKEWHLSTLLGNLKEHTVINSLPDKPEQQLPTAKFGTHAVSVQNQEIISEGSRFWKRENLQLKDWTTGLISEYFVNANLSPAPETPEANLQDKRDVPVQLIQKRDKKEELQFPAKSWDIHLYKPTGEEIIISGSRYYLKKDPAVPNWITGSVEKLFTTLVVAPEVTGIKPAEKPEAAASDTQSVSEKPDEKQVIPVKTEADTKIREKQEEDSRFDALAKRLMEELRKFFRPELLNRFDEVVVFRPLTKNHMLEIVGLQFSLLKKMLEEQDIALTVTPYAQAFLTEIGFDPVFGARPLRRTIQREIENPISSYLIKGDLTAGDTFEIDYDGRELIFNIKKMPVKKPAEPKETASSAATVTAPPPPSPVPPTNQPPQPGQPAPIQSGTAVQPQPAVVPPNPSAQVPTPPAPSISSPAVPPGPVNSPSYQNPLESYFSTTPPSGAIASATVPPSGAEASAQATQPTSPQPSQTS